MTTKQEHDDETRALAALARALKLEASDDARQAKADAARILDAAARMMFGEDTLTVDQVIARILGK